MKKIVLLMLALALSFSTASAEEKKKGFKVNIHTGKPGYTYDNTAEIIKDAVDHEGIKKIKKIKKKNHSGSVDALKAGLKDLNKMKKKGGTIPLIIAQNDAYAALSESKRDKLEEYAVLFPECLYAVSSAKSSIDDDEDIDEKDITVIAGQKGSGQKVTWQTLMKLESDLKKPTTKYKNSNSALSKLKKDKKLVVLLMGKPVVGGKLYKKITKKGVKVASLEDNNFSYEVDGKEVYHTREIPVGKGWFGNKKKETVCTYASLYGPAKLKESIKERIIEVVDENSDVFMRGIKD